MVGRFYRHHGRKELLLDRRIEELRLEDTEHVVPAFHLLGQRRELVAELQEREVLRRQERRRSAAETRSF
jgi:hypothetical protein